MSKSFIGIYDNALTKHECEILISQFEKSSPVWGMTVKDGKPTLNFNHKKCMQLDGPKLSDNSVMSHIIREAVNKCFHKYKKDYPALPENIIPLKVNDIYAFKKFEYDDDGYKVWHCEKGRGHTASRSFVWSFYLNNAKAGTELMYYPTIRAKMGRGVIFPADWTHLHRSAPNKGLKYFVSGWISHE